MGTLTAVILFLIIIVVVLVVCKARIFVRKTPEILETLPSTEKKQSMRVCGNKHSEKQGKINFNFIEDNRHATNVESVLPNRSPRNRAEKMNEMPSKIYENDAL